MWVSNCVGIVCRRVKLVDVVHMRGLDIAVPRDAEMPIGGGGDDS